MAFALTLSELARLVDGHIVRGELDSFYSGMAALDSAQPGDISFLGNEKYRGLFLTTAAGAVIVPRGETGGPDGCALIEVENPTHAFGAVVKHFAKAARPFLPGIHPSAVIDPSVKLDPAKVKIQAGAVVAAGAEIGDGSDVGANSVIGADVKIGRDCVIYSNVSIREGCVLGDRVILQPGVVIGSDGYGYQFIDGRHQKIDQVGIVEIHDDVEIGANTTIDRARFGKTVIGEGTKIDNLVQVGHNVVIGRHCLVVSQTGIAGSARLGDYVTVAAQVGVAGHVFVGDKAVLGARTGVTTTLAGGVTYLGNPAQLLADEQKQRALVRRLPRIADDLKALKKAQS